MNRLCFILGLAVAVSHAAERKLPSKIEIPGLGDYVVIEFVGPDRRLTYRLPQTGEISVPVDAKLNLTVVDGGVTTLEVGGAYLEFFGVHLLTEGELRIMNPKVKADGQELDIVTAWRSFAKHDKRFVVEEVSSGRKTKIVDIGDKLALAKKTRTAASASSLPLTIEIPIPGVGTKMLEFAGKERNLTIYSPIGKGKHVEDQHGSNYVLTLDLSNGIPICLQTKRSSSLLSAANHKASKVVIQADGNPVDIVKAWRAYAERDNRFVVNESSSVIPSSSEKNAQPRSR